MSPVFVKSEDAGYSPGRLLLDMPSGNTISISKIGSKWFESYIKNGVSESVIPHKTRRQAMASAVAWFNAELGWLVFGNRK